MAYNWISFGTWVGTGAIGPVHVIYRGDLLAVVKSELYKLSADFSTWTKIYTWPTGGDFHDAVVFGDPETSDDKVYFAVSRSNNADIDVWDGDTETVTVTFKRFGAATSRSVPESTFCVEVHENDDILFAGVGKGYNAGAIWEMTSGGVWSESYNMSHFYAPNQCQYLAYYDGQIFAAGWGDRTHLNLGNTIMERDNATGTWSESLNVDYSSSQYCLVVDNASDLLWYSCGGTPANKVYNGSSWATPSGTFSFYAAGTLNNVFHAANKSGSAQRYNGTSWAFVDSIASGGEDWHHRMVTYDPGQPDSYLTHKLFLTRMDNTDTITEALEDTSISPPTPVNNEAMGIGLSIDKVLGNKCWVTMCDGTDILMYGVDLPTKAIGSSKDLGAATFAEVNSKDTIAYPYTDFGGFVYAHGRMDDPVGLGTPSHIIGSDDGGSTFYLKENSWDIDICGAFKALPDGTLFAVRNGDLAKLYAGYAGGVTVGLLGTSIVLPVEPHGIDMDFLDGTIVLCSGSPDSIMVAISPYPYYQWFDITSNHGVANGINSVVVLWGINEGDA